MSKTFRDLIKRFEASEWEKLDELREPAQGRAYQGGESIREVLRHKRTGVLIIRHRIVHKNKIKHDHLKPAPPEIIEKFESG
ncbi:MAG: hypothetical protein NZO41_04110 [Candidatus Bipolaricaulota bacterium]|nr:hypothetical protein [Candidatus Bipolaricaulota bacterium]MDW8141469.1 hypothetical protein [Candidatus Bipolaricaulota bacterium]